jgi:hypothetical protein
MGMPELRTEKVTIMLPPSLVSALDRYAERHRRTRSTGVLQLIEEGLAREGLEVMKDVQLAVTRSRSGRSR